MKQNYQQDKQELTQMQKQAILVCTVCALAILLTSGITYGLLKRGKPSKTPVQQPASSEPASSEADSNDISDHYQISQTSAALLTKTADAGTAYQDQTLFLGDSNTVRLYANGLISLQQFCAKEGIGVATALNESFVSFKRDDNLYTVAQAVAKMKPRRVVLTFGTNDIDMEVEDFIRNYTALVQAIQKAYPYTDIIVNTIPPIPEDHGSYPDMDQTKIDDLNMALLEMCEELEIRFLNSAEALKDENGYGKAEYYQTGDIHLRSAGLKAMLSYLRTHACETDDRRPDTTNIPTRAEYTNDPSSAVASSSSSAATSKVLYEVSYRVDKNGGGSLSSGKSTEKALLNFDITDPAKEIAVTAVPDEGYIFVKWSDGVTDPTRTDVDFEEDMDLTAYFEAASIKISASGKAVVGGTYTFKVSFSNNKLKTENIRWYANGYEVDAAGKKTVKVALSQDMADEKYQIQATVTYNGVTLTSNVLEVTVAGVTSASTPEEGADSSSSASSSASSSTGSSSGSSSSSAAASGAASSGTTSGTTSASSGSSAASSEAASSSASSKPSSGSSAASSEAASGSASSKPSSGSSAASSEAASSSASSKPSSGSSAASSEAVSSSASGKPSSGSSAASSEAASSSASSKPSSGSSAASSEAASSSASSKPASSGGQGGASGSKENEQSAGREAPGSAS